MENVSPAQPASWEFKYYWKTIHYGDQQFRVEVLVGAQQYTQPYDIWGLIRANLSEFDEIRANDKCDAVIRQYAALHGIDLASCVFTEGTGKVKCQWRREGFLWLADYTKV